MDEKALFLSVKIKGYFAFKGSNSGINKLFGSSCQHMNIHSLTSFARAENDSLSHLSIERGYF